MRIDIVTVLPEMIREAVTYSILGRAQSANLVVINAVNLRDFAEDRHQTTDDKPCGGGGGMILKPEPVVKALRAIGALEGQARIVLTEPQGEPFCQAKARELAECDWLIFVCGRYEGVDERIRAYVTDELSIGDYVLTGGELPALVMTDAIVRLLPGALGDAEAPEKDSFGEGLLEHPHYTKPREFEGREVPEILLGGHHAEIERWRRKQRLLRTRERRPDLWAAFAPSEGDLALLAEADRNERDRNP